MFQRVLPQRHCGLDFAFEIYIRVHVRRISGLFTLLFLSDEIYKIKDKHVLEISLVCFHTL